MTNRKSKGNGVSSTKKDNSTIGNKRIGSNRNTGNTDYGNKLRNLSAEAQARYKKVQDFKAEKSKFIRSEEFEGDGKIIEILDIDTKAEGKYGPTIQFAVREPKSNRNRIWDCSSIRAVKAIDPLLEIGESLIRVWTTGVRHRETVPC